MDSLTDEALTFNEISIKFYKDQDYCNEVSFLFIKIILLSFVLGIQSHSEYTRGFEEASCDICKYTNKVTLVCQGSANNKKNFYK